ncbi:ABC transporter permease [Alginatibacterium sediminis]|uniref:ABC transporter permease n=1 Tax=Alginatibacterium sediminis TaxID=2164068 RepID=A0A420E5T4_9ALTE|nr:ABC transporter permease [Alginatibacterium sediminis]RKF12810.1 ABC transporter permease [Alginatibacterium sediminis]
MMSYSLILRSLFNDRWLYSLLSWLPLVVFLSIAAIFSSSFARENVIMVVDQDNSRLSRQLIRSYHASPNLSVTMSSNIQTAKDALVKGDIYAYVIIPNDLERDVKRFRSPLVQSYYNGQFLVIGKQVNAALAGIHTTINVGIDVGRVMGTGNTPALQAFGSVMPIRAQMSALFNSNNDYAQFILSGALPAAWQLIIVLSMVLIYSKFLKTESLENKRNISSILRISLVSGAMLVLQGLVMACLLFVYKGWPMRGDWSLIVFAQVLCVMASQAIALFLVFLLKDRTRALSFAAALTAPSFAFMGVTFPLDSMPTFSLLWRQLIPICHYVDIQISQSNHAPAIVHDADSLLKLAMFGLLFLAALCLVPQVQKQEVQA